MRLVLLPLFLVREVWRRLGGTGQREVPLWQDPYRGGPVAVVALYQTGRIRADVLGLLLALRRRGVYVIAVNTGSLAAGGVRLPVDCYVQRRNYGRDFGSYRLGTALVRGLSEEVPRLLLLNDSVFYISRGLEAFVGRLLDSPADICSATDSVEVAPHQTSFCLSFSARCQRAAVFRRFWQHYQPTDLRPATVLFGEIALSRRLHAAGFTHEVLACRERLRAVVDRDPGLVQRRDAEGEASRAAEVCLSGNLTHRVPAALIELGVPLVKLDLLRRRNAAESDLDGLVARLPQDEALRLSDMLHSRAAQAVRAPALDRLGALCGLA